MVTRLRHFSLVLLLGGASLGPWSAAAPGDLDKLTTQQLNDDLEAELDDIYKGHDPDAPVDIDELETEIMRALGDDDDEGLAAVITQEALDAEMAEAGTTLTAVVEHALQVIDEASGPALRPSAFRYAAFSVSKPMTVRTTRRLAVKETKKEIITAIQAVRR